MRTKEILKQLIFDMVIDTDKLKDKYHRMRKFFSKVYEIYICIVMLGFALMVDFIIIGIFVVLPIYLLLDYIECPF